MNNESYCTIKNLPFDERPREKLINYGVKSLSNIELLAVIIRTGYKEKTALDLAKDIIYMDDSGIKNLSQVTYQELTSIKGVGACKACQILASIELGKRINSWIGEEKIQVTSPKTLAAILINEMKFLTKEHFKVATLDTKNQIIGIDNISIGTLNASIVHPRDVFNLAIKKNANSIILVHNHPSGDTTPSKEDIIVTDRLIDVGKIVGIKVLDHIIVGENRYLSFREEGLM